MTQNAVMNLKPKYFLSATPAQTFNNRSSALTGAAITFLALAEPFIAAGAAVGFWYFFPTEKGLGPRGYEREEIILAWSHQALENLFLPVAKRLCESLFLVLAQACRVCFSKNSYIHVFQILVLIINSYI